MLQVDALRGTPTSLISRTATHRKTLIEISDQTFYAIIMPWMKKNQLEDFAGEFLSTLSLSLRSDGFQDHHLEFLTDGQIHYGKTHDRQVLGIINEAINHIRYHVESRGGWEHVSIVGLTKEINRTPWLAGTRKCVFPIEKITNNLKSLLH